MLYVGGVSISFTGYWTTDSEGNVAAYTGTGAPADSYIHYDESTNTLTLHNATIKRELALNPDIPGGTIIAGAAIGVANTNDDAELTIQLEGANIISASTGVHVYANSGTARLTISGDGSLTASGTVNSGIMVQSNSGDATLTIQNTEVTATSTYNDGVRVQSGSSSSASLTVEGSSLIASGRKGILFPEGNPSLNVSDSAIVRASGGIASDDSSETGPVTTGGTGGIVFNGDEGTVYGSVTLQEDLTINEDENLDIPNDASLTIPNGTTLTNKGTVTNSGTLTNNGTINNSGTLPNNISGNGTINHAPTITTVNPLPSGTEGQSYSQKLAAEGTAPTWSVTDGNLPDGLNLNKSTGEIFGTPSAPGTFKFTVTITNTGNQSVTVDLPTSTNYIITAGAGFANGTATIAPNSTAQFTVQPKTGLAIGTYNETITVSGSNGASTSLNANFTVSAVPATDDTPPIKDTPENTASTNDNQVLPQTSDNNFLFMTVLCLISLVSLISGLIALRNLNA